MFREKGTSIGEKTEKDAVASESIIPVKDGDSEELHNYVNQLIDSAHGKCVTPDIIKFVERASK